MKILIIDNKTNNFSNFRKEFVLFLKEQGHEVSLVYGDDKFKHEIEQLGFKVYKTSFNNRSKNIFQILKYYRKLISIIKEEAPNKVITYQLKPNTFGVMAAHKAGVKEIYSMVEGLGDAFLHDSFTWKLIRKIVCILFKKSFKYVKKVFFLNEDDRNEFTDRKLIEPERTVIIDTLGINLKHFNYEPVKNYDVFLFAARLFRTKGIFEYCQAARIAKRQFPKAQFLILGYEGDVKIKDLEEFITDGSVTYLGYTTDIKQYYIDSSVVVLPSYREGGPLVILEGMAIGRPAITTDSKGGCRIRVIDGYNGYKVPVKDYELLAQRMIYFLENPSEIERMSKNGRALIEEKYDRDLINKKIYYEILEDGR